MYILLMHSCHSAQMLMVSVARQPWLSQPHGVQDKKTEFHTPIALHDLSHLHVPVAEQVQ